MSIKTGEYLKGKEIYIDYEFEEVMFRRTKDGQVFQKFYGEEELPKEVPCSSRLYTDALLSGTEISASEYLAGAKNVSNATLEAAIFLAARLHAGQVDKAGAPYILHVLRVMMSMESLEEKVVGVLHDVLEDCNMTPEKLIKNGYSREVVNAVECLTKLEGESYSDFVDRVLRNPLAARVKLADLRDNLNESRLGILTDSDSGRMQKYRAAAERIEQQLAQA